MSIPTWDWSKLRPTAMSMDCVGTSFEGGRAISGATYSVDYSGGGLTMISYKLQLFDPEAHRYWHELRAILNGGVRPINIPMLVTWLNPFFGTLPAEEKVIDFTPIRIPARLADGAALHATQIIIAITTGQAATLKAGHVFSINHAVSGWHLYTVMEKLSATDIPDTDTDTIRYTVKIRPPLREETGQTKKLEFDWPRCVMRLAPGESMSWDVEEYWRSSPTVKFIEYFDPSLFNQVVIP